MSNELAAFLVARLDEDEAVARDARACAEVKDGRWFDGEDEVNDDSGFRLATVNHPFVTAHIARHDPARALREVAAGRAILASLEEDLRLGARTDLTRGGQIALFVTCKRLAAIYSDHPDYRQEWAV